MDVAPAAGVEVADRNPVNRHALAAAGNQSKSKVASDTLAWQIEHICRVSVHREYVFHDTRKWRFDGAIVDLRIAFEIEGGLYSGVKARRQLDVAFAAGAALPAAVVRDALLSQGGRHNKAAGMQGDLEKYNEAAALGWIIVRVMPEWVTNGRALAWMERAIAMRKPTAKHERMLDSPHMSKKTPTEPQISDAQAAARMLGQKGGQTRAKNLSKKERSEIARLGGLARHGIREAPKELPKPRAATARPAKRSRKVRTAAA